MPATIESRLPNLSVFFFRSMFGPIRSYIVPKCFSAYLPFKFLSIFKCNRSLWNNVSNYKWTKGQTLPRFLVWLNNLLYKYHNDAGHIHLLFLSLYRIYAYTQTLFQYFKMTKLNETKVEDLISMYNHFKRINQQYRGKVFNNIINSLAERFYLHLSLDPWLRVNMKVQNLSKNLEK